MKTRVSLKYFVSYCGIQTYSLNAGKGVYPGGSQDMFFAHVYASYLEILICFY